MVFTNNQIGVYPVGGGGGGGAPLELVNAQFLTTSSNWDGATAVASGTEFVTIMMSGAGGGGASGERNLGTNQDGGVGGEAGDVILCSYIPVSNLSLTESFISGVGGAGGAGVTINGDLGNPGAAGGKSSFHNFQAKGGVGGFSSDVQPGDLGAGSVSIGNYNDSGISVQLAITATGSLASLNGGTGGGLYSGLATVGDSSSSDITYLYLSVPVVSAGGSVSVGENGKVYGSYFATGGGGGGSNNTGTTPFAGGNGLHGSGGGGGSVSTDGIVSGAGGTGGNGVVLVLGYKTV